MTYTVSGESSTVDSSGFKKFPANANAVQNIIVISIFFMLLNIVFYVDYENRKYQNYLDQISSNSISISNAEVKRFLLSAVTNIACSHRTLKESDAKKFNSFCSP